MPRLTPLAYKNVGLRAQEASVSATLSTPQVQSSRVEMPGTIHVPCIFVESGISFIVLSLPFVVLSVCFPHKKLHLPKVRKPYSISIVGFGSIFTTSCTWKRLLESH